MAPRMVSISVAGIAGAALALTACGSSKHSGSSGPVTVNSGPTVITKLLSFEPDKLTVKVGTTVTWHVSDSIAHTVTTGSFTLGGNGLRSVENPDGLINKPLRHGGDVSFTFDKAGTYTYFCSIHKGMNGEIVVTK